MNRTVRLLPVIAVPAVVIAGAVSIPAMASAAPSLPHKSAAQVLQLIAHAEDAHYSGTVEQTADLGLPQLPSGATTGGSGADSAYANVLELLGGSHTAKIYVDGAAKQRVQVLDSLAERDVIRNGSTVWTWDSKKNAATKTTLPSKTADAPSGATQNPADLATKLVDHLSSSTKLSVDSTARVAGRAAYQLTLTPRSSTTLVKHVTLSVDSATGLPLRVVVAATGQKAAAFSAGFTSIDFGTPSASLFSFTAPKGAKVTTKDLSSAKDHDTAPSGSGTPDAPTTPTDKPTVVGTGWDAVAILPASLTAKATGSGSASGSAKDASGLLDQLTTKVAGGRTLQTSLVSVLLTDDGRVLVGAVPVSSLQSAAG